MGVRLPLLAPFFMKLIRKERIKRELFPLFIVVSSFLLNIVYFKNLPHIIPFHFNLLGEADRFVNKINVFNFNLIIMLLYLLFLVVDNWYYKICKRRNIFYFQEVYLILNLVILVILGLQFSVIQYSLNKVETIYTYFLPFTSILFLILMILILRLILRSASIGR